MKRLTAMILSVLFAVSLFTGCNVKTKDDVKGPDATQSSNPKGTGDTAVGRDPIPITLLSLSSLETETNVVRDQLKKAGFDVTLSIQPDYGSLSTQVDARNYDIYMGTMKVLSGNPDYGCRSMFYSTGIDNDSKVVDSEVDRLIDLGASQLPQD